MEDQFTKLACSSCGGTLEVDKATIDSSFMDLGEGSFVFIGSASGGDTYTCKYCGTKFERRAQFKVASGINASIKIKGPVIGSNIVIGNGNKINSRRG